MWDGRIYYLKHGQEDPVVGRAPVHLWALDVFTGENQEVTPQGWPEDMYYMYQNAGWGNFWLFAVSHGMDGDSVYQLDLSDRSFAELGRIGEFDSQASIRQEGETVYWSSCFAAATGFCLTVTEYDMETKTAVEREDVIPIGFDDSVLCSFPCGIGCYYDETWESHTDTYYYDYATGTAVCISPAQTETNPATAERVTHDGGEICWDECAALQEGDNLYYSTWQYYPERGDVVSPGLWYYDVENGTSELLGSFAAAFTQTLNGNFCTDRDGTVYRLENGTMERIGTVPQNEYGGNCTLLDVVGDTAYYTSASEMGGSVDIWEKSLSDGGSGRQIYVGEPGYTLEKAACRNGTIYYETLYHTADPSFWALDVETGENTQLEFDFPYDEHGGLYLTHICEFYEDCILLLGQFYDNTEGLFRLDYETLAAEETWRLESGMYAPIYREGDLIYFSSVGWVNDETGAQTRMVSAVSLDVNRGDVELKGVPDEAGDMWAASRGCYYQKRPDSPADTAESMEIYYYNYETRESVCINYECLKTYQNNTPGS